MKKIAATEIASKAVVTAGIRIGKIIGDESIVDEIKALNNRMHMVAQSAFYYRRQYVALINAMRNVLCVNPNGYRTYDKIVGDANREGKAIDAEFALKYAKAIGNRIGEFRRRVIEEFGYGLNEIDMSEDGDGEDGDYNGDGEER